MIESLLMLLIYILIVGVVLWLISYVVDMLPMDPNFKRVAKVAIAVIGVIILILMLIRFLPLGGPLLP